jgi:tRNA-splicing ligase RtcB
METTEISISDICSAGITDADMIKVFHRLANAILRNTNMDKATVLTHVNDVLRAPYLYTAGWNKFSAMAQMVIEYRQNGKPYGPADNDSVILSQAKPYQVFGKRHIQPDAFEQMDVAMRLPITVTGALMPDAHKGYGLPIGGVLATQADKIIPFAVGVDIACRMCLSVFDIPSAILHTQADMLKSLLVKHTVFGASGKTKTKYDSSIIDRPEWEDTDKLRSLKDKAYEQLGTSGTGNHFVEWGEIELTQTCAEINMPAGKYLALLSHSGSRGVGAGIANTYSRIAISKTNLPQQARHFAWLDMNSEEGFEYWLSMNLAGDYAAANHHEIHNKMAKGLGVYPVSRIENHHNFAWLEQLADGTPVMVHRKGATPAANGQAGIIPGSMAALGYVVRGKGLAGSLNSASHGAGRALSRSAALRSITAEDMQHELLKNRIELIGGGIDEAPMAYKDIKAVMAAQADQVEVLAKFKPAIVRMAWSKERSED